MNLCEGQATAGGVQLPDGLLPLRCRPAVAGRPAVTVGMRASALRVQPRAGDIALPGRVELAEISGSDTFVHVRHRSASWWRSCTGVHVFDARRAVTLHLDPSQVYVFDAQGALLVAPGTRPGGGSLRWPASTSTWRTAYAPTRSATRTTRCCR
jgi:glycerol transport system ATP-binding protein